MIPQIRHFGVAPSLALEIGYWHWGIRSRITSVSMSGDCLLRGVAGEASQRYCCSVLGCCPLSHYGRLWPTPRHHPARRAARSGEQRDQWMTLAAVVR